MPWAANVSWFAMACDTASVDPKFPPAPQNKPNKAVNVLLTMYAALSAHPKWAAFVQLEEKPPGKPYQQAVDYATSLINDWTDPDSDTEHLQEFVFRSAQEAEDNGFCVPSSSRRPTRNQTKTDTAGDQAANTAGAKVAGTAGDQAASTSQATTISQRAELLNPQPKRHKRSRSNESKRSKDSSRSKRRSSKKSRKNRSPSTERRRSPSPKRLKSFISRRTRLCSELHVPLVLFLSTLLSCLSGGELNGEGCDGRRLGDRRLGTVKSPDTLGGLSRLHDGNRLGTGSLVDGHATLVLEGSVAPVAGGGRGDGNHVSVG